MKPALSIIAALCVLLLWSPDAVLAKPKRKHLPVTSPGDKNYKLIVSDRFNERQLNSDIWKYLDSTTTIPHTKSQFEKEACLLEHNAFVLKVEKVSDQLYHSCGLVMTPKYSITYGKYEVHAMIDKGAGWQGIIELVPTDEKDHSNVELAGYQSEDRQSVELGAHYTSENLWQGQDVHYINGSQLHTFTVEWTPSDLRFWVDRHYKYGTTLDVPTTRMALRLRTTATGKVSNPGGSMTVVAVHMYMYLGNTNHTIQTQQEPPQPNGKRGT